MFRWLSMIDKLWPWATLLAVLGATLPAAAGDEPLLPPLTLEDVAARVEAAWNEIDDLDVIVELEQYNPTDGAVTSGRGRLRALVPDLFRFDWLLPDMMAGSILLIDRARNEARQYNPVREEIIVQQWDQLAQEQNLGQDVDRWLTLPDAGDYALELGKPAVEGHRAYYTVLARPHGDPGQLYEFLVDPETWLVQEFRYYDPSGRLLLRGRLADVTINHGVSEERLRRLPPAAVRHR